MSTRRRVAGHLDDDVLSLLSLSHSLVLIHLARRNEDDDAHSHSLSPVLTYPTRRNDDGMHALPPLPLSLSPSLPAPRQCTLSWAPSPPTHPYPPARRRRHVLSLPTPSPPSSPTPRNATTCSPPLSHSLVLTGPPHEHKDKDDDTHALPPVSLSPVLTHPTRCENDALSLSLSREMQRQQTRSPPSPSPPSSRTP
ncbi:hypothetical protein OG21DRAFT_1489346 [Imleria badia]|nr:hypothetical protein OG21DRAFT_1489346 [Imleria badia]